MIHNTLKPKDYNPQSYFGCVILAKAYEHYPDYIIRNHMTSQLSVL